MSLEGTCGGLTDFGCDNVLLLEEGVAVGSSSTLNFVGSGITATLINGIGTITVTGGGGASTFDAIGSGTNTTAAMVVGSGATLAATGSGTIVATSTTGNAATVTTNANLTGPITSSGNATSIASQTGTGTKFVVDTSPTLVTPNIGTATGTGLILTSASATALAVGPSGSTNPAFIVDASTASSVTGLKIVTGAAGNGVNLSVVSSFTDESITITGKGATNNVTCNAGSSGVFRAQVASSTKLSISSTAFLFTNLTALGTSAIKFTYNSPSGDSNITASTEATQMIFNFNQSRQWATGALTLQREFRLRSPTYTFIGASTLTDAATFSIDGAPIGGTNATLTNSHALYIPTAALTNTTNGYGINVAAPTGATNNYAALFSGNVSLTAGFGTGIRVVTAAGAVTGSNTDGTIVINKGTGAATAVSLPAGCFTGQTFTVKDGKGDSLVNNITITPNSGTIDGAATYVIATNKASVNLQFDGTNWWAV